VSVIQGKLDITGKKKTCWKKTLKFKATHGQSGEGWRYSRGSVNEKES